jgi:hypothetical protein
MKKESRKKERKIDFFSGGHKYCINLMAVKWMKEIHLLYSILFLESKKDLQNKELYFF